ncbi:MFS transporter [Kyrpidia spormannii]|nr:MFS transporter [Kyrpidia spormannii]
MRIGRRESVEDPETSWRRPLYLLWLSNFIAVLGLNFQWSFIPLYLPHLGVTSTRAVGVWSGAIMAVTPLVAAITGPLWGNFADKHGRRRVVIQVYLANIFIIGAMGFVHQPWQLFILRILQGALGGVAAASLSLVTSITPADRLGSALGLYQTSNFTAAAIGPFFGGLLADLVSIRFPYVLLGALNVVAALLVWLGVAEPSGVRPVGRGAEQGFFGKIWTLVRRPGLLSLAMTGAMVQFGVVVIAPVIPLFVRHLLGDSRFVGTVTGLLVALAGVAGSVSAVVAGQLGDRYGHRRLLVFMCIGAAIVFGWTGTAETIVQLIALRTAAGLFIGGLLPTSNALIGQLVSESERGTAFGMTTSFQMMGTVLGPLVGGALGTTLGFSSVFWTTMVVFFLTALWVYGSGRRQAGREELGT